MSTVIKRMQKTKLAVRVTVFHDINRCSVNYVIGLLFCCPENTLCAAPMFGGWFRALVISYNPDSDECFIRFVDYGGYAQLAAHLLQQIRWLIISNRLKQLLNVVISEAIIKNGCCFLLKLIFCIIV